MSKPNDIPDKMVAIRLHGRGFDSIRVDELPVPVPNDNQLLVSVDAAGVCSSNLKLLAQGSEHTFINGWDLSRFPIILGDEGCVSVVRAGKNVADRYPIGQRYATQPAVDHAPINHRERYAREAEGMRKCAVGYTLPGHLAQYMLVTEETLAAECLLPVPAENVPFFAGALCEPLSCVISAQSRHIHLSQEAPTAPREATVGLKRGGVAMIIGAGPMGRMHAEAALRFGPKHVIVVDISRERLHWVEQVLIPRASSTSTQVHAVLTGPHLPLLHELSNDRGADDIIVSVGNRAAQIDAQAWLAQGGVLNLFGGLKRGEHILELDSLRVHYDEVKIVGSSGGTPADVVEALRMVAAAEFDPGLHLTMVGSLDQLPKALRLVEQQETDGKIVLYPHIQTTELFVTKNWGLAEEQALLKERAPRD